MTDSILLLLHSHIVTSVVAILHTDFYWATPLH
jgi:hypothetical protein